MNDEQSNEGIVFKNNTEQGSDMVRSNLEYVKSSMSKINDSIKSACDFNQKNHSIISTADKNSLYDSINRISNKYFQAERMMMEKLKNESDFNVSVAESYEKLDNDLKKKAGKL